MKSVASYTPHQQKGIVLNANEKPTNLSTQIIQEIQEALPSIAFNRYPDDTYQELKEKYGALCQIGADQILVGNGSDQMLGLMIGSYISKGKKAFTLDPDFGMYDYYVSMYDGELEKFVLDPFHPVDVDSLIAQAKKVEPSLILFSNPNNPTGLFLDRAQIEKILKAFPNTPVLVDEAYIEFAPESAIDLIALYPNLYITRTLSKAFGLAGIRLGFLLSQKENIDQLKTKMVPYSVNQISELAAKITLDHYDQVQTFIEETKKRREVFIEQGHRFKTIDLYPSQANFVLITAKDLDKLLAKMKANSITIRDYAHKAYARITIGSEAEMEQVISVLEEVERESVCEKRG